MGLDGVDALLVYLEYSGCMFFWALYNYVTRRCKGNLMVHTMMDYRDEKGVHICPHPTSLGQRCLYNIQAVVFWLEGVIRHVSISCVSK